MNDDYENDYNENLDYEDGFEDEDVRELGGDNLHWGHDDDTDDDDGWYYDDDDDDQDGFGDADDDFDYNV